MRITGNYYPTQQYTSNSKKQNFNNKFGDVLQSETQKADTTKATAAGIAGQPQQSAVDLDSIIAVLQAKNAAEQAKIPAKPEYITATKHHDLDSILSSIQNHSSWKLTGPNSYTMDGNIFFKSGTHGFQPVESIYSIPNGGNELALRFAQAVDDCAYLDTSGMTSAEIYKSVESVFAHSLGNDFLEPDIIYGGVYALNYAQDVFPVGTYNSIRVNFNYVLHKLGINPAEMNDAYIEAKGYAGMNKADKAEMYAAVRAKYPENMTLKDCMLMSYDLSRLGAEDTAYYFAVAENISTTLWIANGAEHANLYHSAIYSKRVFDAILNKPADYETMKAAVESHRGADGLLHFTHDIGTIRDNLIDILLSWFGGGGLYDNDMIDELMGLLDEMRNNTGIISA
jgi:hypothetical protein